MSKYGPGDAARDTGSSSRETSQAWHQARDDAAKSGDLNERNVSDSEEGGVLYSLFKAVGLVKGRSDW